MSAAGFNLMCLTNKVIIAQPDYILYNYRTFRTSTHKVLAARIKILQQLQAHAEGWEQECL